MSNIVIIGAGQTGRGYLNRFFQAESITFLDKDEELIHALQTEPCYHVSFGPGARKPLELENYNAYLIDSEDGTPGHGRCRSDHGKCGQEESERCSSQSEEGAGSAYKG